MARLTGGLAAGIALLSAATFAWGEQPGVPELSFQRVEGQNLNAFVREGPVAAHLLLRNGTDPRILVAFPAGNSGVGLWFERLDTAATWTLETPPQPVTL